MESILVVILDVLGYRPVVLKLFYSGTLNNLCSVKVLCRQILRDTPEGFSDPLVCRGS
jgi:hypothetical protein